MVVHDLETFRVFNLLLDSLSVEVEKWDGAYLLSTHYTDKFSWEECNLTIGRGETFYEAILDAFKWLLDQIAKAVNLHSLLHPYIWRRTPIGTFRYLE